MDLHAVEISKKKMERGAESSPLLPAQTLAERNLKSYQVSKLKFLLHTL
jgi:hypothetical protein